MAITPMPQVLASLGLLERVAYEAQTQPELVSQAAQETAVHTLKQESDQIEKTETSQEGEKVSLDGGREENAGRGRKRKRARAKKKEPAPNAQNPWSGNILNVRI